MNWKLLFFTVLAGVATLAVWEWLRPKRNTRIKSQAQRMAGSNSTLSSYSEILPPIAQLERVPGALINARRVDPVWYNPYYPLIPQNGGMP